MAGLPTPIKPSQPTPTVPFQAYTSRRTQDIVAAGPYSLPQNDIVGGNIPAPSTMVVTTGGFINKLRNASFDIWQRGNQVNSIAAGIPTYCADGWVHAWMGTVGTVARAAGRGSTLYSLQFMNPTGIYTDMQLGQRIESQIACALGGGNCTFQAQIYNGTSDTDDVGTGILLSVGHCASQDIFNPSTTAIVWDIQNVQLQSCPAGEWTQIAYTFNLPAASAQSGIYLQLDFGQALNSATDTVNIAECDLRATPGLSIGLNNNPPMPEFRPYTLELLICSAYYQNVFTLPMFYGQVTAGQSYYATDEFVTPMRIPPTIITTDVQNSYFPAGAPVVNYFDTNGFRVSKTANTTPVGPGFYIFGYTASAEL